MRTRLNSSDRRASIITAAKTVFARFGFEGAKTQQIAAAAKVSEALLYRHFPSKTALYRAVLRATIEDQERSIASIGMPLPGALGLVTMLVSLFYNSALGVQSPGADGIKMVFASLAGDGTFARLVYRRGVKRTLLATDTAIKQAVADGDAVEMGIAIPDLINMIAHMGLMTQAMRMAENRVPDSKADEEFIRRCVWFAGRGMGLTDAALATHFPVVMQQFASEPEASQAPAPAKSRKPRKKAEKA